MNGIAGIVYPDNFQVNDRIIPMLDALQSEADEADRDLHTRNNIQIATVGRRLAVSEKGTIIGGFEGAVSNRLKLMHELEKHGYRFSTGNQMEVLVHAYELWDLQFLEMIEGDFALMILDPKKERIILARDRIGKKRLYWAHSRNYFIFGSQLKSLLATGIVPQTAALDAVSAYFHLGYIPQDLSPVKEVNKLLPGHYLIFNFDGSKQIKSFWSYSSYFEKQIKKHKNTIAEELGKKIEDAVKIELSNFEDHTGCLLSGGLGSATIAYYLSKFRKDLVTYAYTAGFKKENDEDIEIAKQAASALHLDQTIHKIDPKNFLDDLIKIVWHLDEPLADPNIVATWNLAKLAASKSEVVFSGMGSDEFLAGHNRYTVKEEKLDLLHQVLYPLAPAIQTFLVPLLNKISKKMTFKLTKQLRTDPWQYQFLKQSSLFGKNDLGKAAPRIYRLFDPESFLHKFHHLTRIQSTVSSYLYIDVKTRLADCYILQLDRLTTAHRLNWRAPFLDRHLVEYAASLPEPEHLAESETASYLKIVMEKKLPAPIVSRPKISRPHFLNSWANEPAIKQAFEALKGGTLIETGLISEAWLAQKLSSPKKCAEAFHQLFAILVMEIWFQLFLNRPIGNRPPSCSIQTLIKEI